MNSSTRGNGGATIVDGLAAVGTTIAKDEEDFGDCSLDIVSSGMNDSCIVLEGRCSSDKGLNKSTSSSKFEACDTGSILKHKSKHTL